jgi:unsaturated rhamnogalacturonyl hydrolase
MANAMFDEVRAAKVKAALLAMQRKSWEQGVAAQAFLEAGDDATAILLAREAVVHALKDGRVGLVEGDRPATDPASIGEPLLRAARATGDARLAAAADRLLEFLLLKAPRSPEGLIYHNFVERRIWVDSIYMAPPFLAAAGRPEEAVAQIVGYRKALRDPGTGLYRHMWDDDTRSFARAAFWGVGNGWAVAGMTRVIRALPPAMDARRRELELYVGELVAAALPFQRPDGLFHDVLDDPATFVETNAAQMMAYSIYRGVASGYLDPALIERAEAMRAAALAKVDELGFVQGVCGAPRFDSPGTAAEGQAFHILMEAARADLPGLAV